MGFNSHAEYAEAEVAKSILRHPAACLLVLQASLVLETHWHFDGNGVSRS